MIDWLDTFKPITFYYWMNEPFQRSIHTLRTYLEFKQKYRESLLVDSTYYLLQVQRQVNLRVFQQEIRDHQSSLWLQSPTLRPCKTTDWPLSISPSLTLYCRCSCWCSLTLGWSTSLAGETVSLNGFYQKLMSDPDSIWHNSRNAVIG